jgi:Concanavalin A-like lectin/glucanases superfamily
MGTYAGSKIVRDSGLKFHFDARNYKSTSNPYNPNILNWAPWVAGNSGSAPIYYQNGDGNSRIIDTNPYGEQDVVWDVSNQDATSDADGGWNAAASGHLLIDSSKMYRFSTWVRRKTIGNGSFYLGCYGINAAGTNEGVINRSDGTTVNTNPYFKSVGWTSPLVVNNWYYVVGHVWPAGSGAGSVYSDTGWYNADGTKTAISMTDYVWQSTNIRTYHRCYLYYSTDTSTNQQFYQPRIDLVDGNELPLSHIFQNKKQFFYSVYDISGNEKSGELVNGANITNQVLNTDGVDDWVDFKDLGENLSTFTVDALFKVEALPSSAVYVPIVSNNYPGNTSNINFYLGFYNSTNSITGGLFDGTWRITTASTISANTWYNYTVTYDGSQIKLYKNGELDQSPTSYTGSPISSNAGIRMGKRYDTTLQYANSEISAVKIYNRALSEAEIHQNFAAVRGRYGL